MTSQSRRLFGVSCAEVAQVGVLRIVFLTKVHVPPYGTAVTPPPPTTATAGGNNSEVVGFAVP